MAKANQHCLVHVDKVQMHLVMIKRMVECFSCGQNFNEEQLSEELSNRKFHQRVKQSQKTYSREKQKQLKAEDLQSFHARNSNT